MNIITNIKKIRIFSSYILPILLALIIYSIYIIYFSPSLLCDDFTLYDLKKSLTHELYKYRFAEIKSECFRDLYDQLMAISRHNFRNFSEETNLINSYTHCRAERREAYHKILEIESHIKAFQPEFKCSLAQNYIRISKL